MQWSRYNLLFESQNNGWLLYNSGSNTFAQFEEDAAGFVKQIEENPGLDFSDNPGLYFTLRQGGFLVEDGKDDDLYRILKMRRLSLNYLGNQMVLTIALTRDCNFNCPYCFQSDKHALRMSDKTEENLANFIEEHKAVDTIAVVWYGGEPLLEFDKIKSITNKITAIGRKYSASMITNGYLLTPEKINCLNDLQITYITITLDGMKETHDSRRTLKDGSGTFDKIVENIDSLMQSDYSGDVSIRVNIDETNADDFLKVYKFIENRYPEQFLSKKIGIYPCPIADVQQNFDVSACANYEFMGNFFTKFASEQGFNSTLTLYPKMNLEGCCLTRKNHYVVGPSGELYKCYLDIGKESEIVGNVANMNEWNVSLIAEGMVGATYLDDINCQGCFFFPICDGGCHKIRIYNNRDNGGRDTCTFFRDNIKEMLEYRYEQKMKGA